MYTDRSAALNRVRERSGISSAPDDVVIEMLTLSAGKDSAGATHYRPFLVAANLLEQDKPTQALDEAKGVKFTKQATTIASLRNQQGSIDLALGLIVPPGFEAAVPTAETTRKTSTQRYSTRSVPVQVRP